MSSTAPSCTLARARGTALEAALDDIQLMPPGTHHIEPMGADGRPMQLTVRVDAATAGVLEAARARYQAEADAGTGDAPYIDFNHQDGPAAGWVKSIYWAGDDPQTGGVRAKIEWSDAGREAVEGRTFRRFSPSFYVDARTGTITGAPVNMGGLVNRAAFRRIAAFFAQSTPSPTPTPTPTMTEEQIAALQQENENLKQQLAELQQQIAALQQRLAEADKAKAEAEVETAAREGRIPAAAEVKAKWVQAILAHPDSRELLASLPPHDALKPALRVQARPGDDDTSPAAIKARYDAMPDGAEKDAFRRRHAATLLAAARAAK